MEDLDNPSGREENPGDGDTGKKILDYLQAGNKLDVAMALKLFSTVDLRKYISTLRKNGNPYNIRDEWYRLGKKKFKRYFIMKQSGSEEELL